MPVRPVLLTTMLTISDTATFAAPKALARKIAINSASPRAGRTQALGLGRLVTIVVVFNRTVHK